MDWFTFWPSRRESRRAGEGCVMTCNSCQVSHVSVTLNYFSRHSKVMIQTKKRQVSVIYINCNLFTWLSLNHSFFLSFYDTCQHWVLHFIAPFPVCYECSCRRITPSRTILNEINHIGDDLCALPYNNVRKSVLQCIIYCWIDEILTDFNLYRKIFSDTLTHSEQFASLTKPR